MTEKQFKVTNISKNGNTGLFWFGKDNLSVYDIVRLLNELFDENKELTEENEQLKADNNRLVNETARIVAEHQKRVLDLIDKSLEKDKQYYEMSYEDYLNGRIESLEELKKELSE